MALGAGPARVDLAKRLEGPRPGGAPCVPDRGVGHGTLTGEPETARSTSCCASQLSDGACGLEDPGSSRDQWREPNLQMDKSAAREIRGTRCYLNSCHITVFVDALPVTRSVMHNQGTVLLGDVGRVSLGLGHLLAARRTRWGVMPSTVVRARRGVAARTRGGRTARFRIHDSGSCFPHQDRRIHIARRHPPHVRPPRQR